MKPQDSVSSQRDFQLLVQTYFAAVMDELGSHVFFICYSFVLILVDVYLTTVAINSTATFNPLLVDVLFGSPPAKSDTLRNTITGVPADVVVC